MVDPANNQSIPDGCFLLGGHIACAYNVMDRQPIPDIDFPDIPTFDEVTTSSTNASTFLANITAAPRQMSNNFGIFGNSSSLLCGFPGVCQGSTLDIYKKCFNTTLLTCEECGVGPATVFLVFAVFMGLAIFIGNALAICIGYRRFRRKKLTKIDISRTSLAISDILTTIRIFVIVVYNFSWTMNLTPLELDAQQLELRSTPQAFAAGIFQLFGFTSSLYHLCFMGLQRTFAIARPILYKLQRNKSVYLSIVCVWTFALLTATVPAWFPRELTFSYLTSALIYSPTPSNIFDPSYTASIAVIVLLYLIPYLLMTTSTIGTGVLLFKRYQRKKLNLTNLEAVATIEKQTLRAFTTVGIMQIGFTIAQVPIAIVVVLVYTSYLDCSNLSQPYLACILLSMTNSFINVIIYNVRDKEFRSEFASIFKLSSKKNVTNTGSSLESEAHKHNSKLTTF